MSRKFAKLQLIPDGSLPKPIVSVLNQLQSAVEDALTPLTSRPQNTSRIIANVPLIAGRTSINHGLGGKLTGWKIVRQRGNARLYDDQDNNPNSALTLVIISDAPVSVDIEVF